MYCYDRAALRAMLKKQGMTVSDLFRALVRAGYEGGRGPIADCVAGKVVPDADRVALIASVLDVAPAEFFFGGTVRMSLPTAPVAIDPSAEPDAEADEPSPTDDNEALDF